MDMAGDAAHLAGKAWMQPNGKVATLCNFNFFASIDSEDAVRYHAVQKRISVADKFAAYHGGIHLLGLISALDM